MTDANDEEQRVAEALARALDGVDATPPAPEVDDPEVAELLRVAERVRATGGMAAPLDPGVREVIVKQALTKTRAPRRAWAPWVAVAVAAGVVLCILGGLSMRFLSVRPVDLDGAFAAPTDTLFDGPFPEDQSASERLDRIVQARTRGYFDAMIMERRATRPAAASIVAVDVTSESIGEVPSHLAPSRVSW